MFAVLCYLTTSTKVAPEVMSHTMSMHDLSHGNCIIETAQNLHDPICTVLYSDKDV